jgi:phosphomethylpyrimidine synthase
MKITEDVRHYAAEQGVPKQEAVKHGLEEKAKEFATTGQVYQRV